MSHFKNIKVNYTNYAGKRSSTTINFAICERLYWEKVDYKTRRKIIEEENYQKERKLITEIAQEFVNNILKSQKEDTGSIRGTSQYGIETHMLMELIKY